MSNIHSKRDLKHVIDADLFRYYGDNSSKVFKKAYKFVPGFRFTYWLRKCDYLSKRPSYTRVSFYYARWRYSRLKVKYGFDIEYSTKIGEGLYLGHWGGVVIHPQSVIGKNCNISHQVTIGVDSGKGEDAVPKIGDNVYLAPGSKIFGKISLGDNCAVGANSVVNEDVLPGITAAGLPAKVVSNQGSAAYVKNIYNSVE
jgi:serine O-acetyltransferase